MLLHAWPGSLWAQGSRSEGRRQQRTAQALQRSLSPAHFPSAQVVDFSNDFYHEHWDIEKVGVPDNGARCGCWPRWLQQQLPMRLGGEALLPFLRGVRAGMRMCGGVSTCCCRPALASAPTAETRRRVFDRGQDRAEAYINEDDNLVFEGEGAGGCGAACWAGLVLGRRAGDGV